MVVRFHTENAGLAKRLQRSGNKFSQKLSKPGKFYGLARVRPSKASIGQQLNSRRGPGDSRRTVPSHCRWAGSADSSRHSRHRDRKDRPTPRWPRERRPPSRPAATGAPQPPPQPQPPPPPCQPNAAAGVEAVVVTPSARASAETAAIALLFTVLVILKSPPDRRPDGFAQPGLQSEPAAFAPIYGSSSLN